MSPLIVCFIVLTTIFTYTFINVSHYITWVAVILGVISGILSSFILGGTYAIWRISRDAKKQGHRNDLKGRGARSKI